MTREEQLVFCKQCTNRKMDMQQGIICSLTSAPADFIGECASYLNDPAVVKPVRNTPLDKEEIRSTLDAEAYERLRMEQNLPLASLAGITAGLVGAILWGAISVATGYQIGYLAIAIGALVGFSIRYFGKGIDPVFGITGATLAVLSCFVGNFFSIIGVLANQENLGYLETFLSFDYAYFMPVMSETFSPVDLFFYGLAGYEGYKFSFRPVTEEEIAILKKK